MRPRLERLSDAVRRLRRRDWEEHPEAPPDGAQPASADRSDRAYEAAEGGADQSSEAAGAWPAQTQPHPEGDQTADRSPPPPTEAPAPQSPPPKRLPPWDWRRLALLCGGAVAAGVVGAAIALGVSSLIDQPEEPSGPAPRVVLDPAVEPETPDELGFPSFATQNTTRIGGAGAAADAAGVALATYPSAGVPGPPAVTIVGPLDWQGAVAAAALSAEPIGAPLLVSEDSGVSDLTLEAIRALAPQGSEVTGGAQAFRVGSAGVPVGLQIREIEGTDPATLAARIDRLRSRLTDSEPRQVLVVASDAPGFAVPAAAWAARSGDPVLFVDGGSVPPPTLRALQSHKGTKAYVLGPERIVSDAVLAQIEQAIGGVERIAGDTAVTNAIEFARFADGEFGWDINDPGHGFVLANSSRPLDAAVAAPLSATGKPGPLLLTDQADAVPDALRGFLLDTKPGFIDDPTRAVYNHVWLIGDENAIGLEFQAQVDELTELAPVGDGAGASVAPQAPPPTGSQ